MPIIKSAIKRVKQATQRRERNIGLKKNIKAAVKSFTIKPSAEGLAKVQSEIDTAVKKKLIKKTTAARRKAQYAKIAKEAGVKLSTAKKSTAAKTPAKKPTAKKPATKATTTKKPATKAAAAKKPATKAPAKKPAAKKTAAKKTDK